MGRRTRRPSLLARHIGTFSCVVISGRRLWVLIPTLVLSGSAVAATAERPVTEQIDLSLMKRTGTTKFEHKGRATGTIKGSVRSKITITNSVVLRGTATITTPSGKLKMRLSGRARSLGTKPRFTGDAKMTGGTGRYADAHGTGRFTGVVNRSTWHATIKATGSFSY